MGARTDVFYLIKRLSSRFSVFTLTAIWIAATVLGIWRIQVYAKESAPSAPVPNQWPSNSDIAFDRTKPTLIVFLHPKCPCSETAVQVIQELAEANVDRVNVDVVFVRPALTDSNWIRTDLYRKCLAVPRFHVHVDMGGRLAKRFGAKASGHVVVFQPSGKLTFSGGLTPFRGGEVTPTYVTRLAQSIFRPTSQVLRSPVYGCSLI